MPLADGGTDLTSRYAATNSFRLVQTGASMFFTHRPVEHHRLDDLVENPAAMVENTLEDHSPKDHRRSRDQWTTWTVFSNIYWIL